MQLFAKYAVVFICVTSLIFSWRATQHPQHAGGIVFSRTYRHLVDDMTHILPRDPASDNSTTYWAVTCVYCVSGVYSRFQRILFYVVMVFIFCVRFHDWLTASGVALIVTYSTTAAFHGIALSLQPNIGTNLDFAALDAVLIPGMVGSTVFALYYPQILEVNATPLFSIWSAFLSFAYLFLFANFSRYINGFGDSAVMVACDTYGNCNDTCPNIEQRVLFRSSLDNMMPIYLGPWVIDNSTPIDVRSSNPTNITALSSAAYISLTYTSPEIGHIEKILPITILCGLLIRTTLANLSYPPGQARNWVVRVCTSKRTAEKCGFSRTRLVAAQALFTMMFIWRALAFVIWPLLAVHFIIYALIKRWDPKGIRRGWIFKNLGIRNEPSKLRLRIATGFALAWYFWACTAYICWPAIFSFCVIWVELSANGMPESEAIQDVGQWGPWVSAGLAFIVACITKRFANAKEKATKPIYLNEAEEPLTQESSKSWKSVRNWKGFIFLAEQWTELKSWWNDPMGVSWNSIDNSKKSCILEERVRNGETGEKTLLAWCKQDAEAEIGYENVLERITNRGEVTGRSHGWYLPKAEIMPGRDSTAANSNAAWWALNNSYEVGEELERVDLQKGVYELKNLGGTG